MKKIIFLIIMIVSLSSCTQAMQEEQIAIARDSSRISDMKSLEAAIQMIYQDNSEYPSSLEELSIYLPFIPQDPKNGELINGNKFEYLYETSKNEEGVIDSFRISTYFESEKNSIKYTMDNGIYDDKFEIFN